MPQLQNQNYEQLPVVVPHEPFVTPQQWQEAHSVSASCVDGKRCLLN